jgi:hypothetical protein
MTLADLLTTVDGFGNWSHADKIKLFAWYLHTYESRTHFTAPQIASCYQRLNAAPPSSIAPFLAAMEKRKPKEALKDSAGYRLENRVREKLDLRFGQRSATVQVHKILTDLPAKIPATTERAYLEEALICFRHKAFRTSIVMCWNLAYDHLCEYVLAMHLAAFNSQFPKTYPKADFSPVVTRDHFGVLKESQVLQVCKSAGIVSDSIHKIPQEKLNRRNIAAHPSGVHISEATAEEFIKDLVENVVMKFT